MSHIRELSPDEHHLLKAVTGVAVRDLGQEWGPCCRRDGRDESGLTVDVTFEEAGLALELTSLQDPQWLAANSAARKLERRLTALARERGWGGWVVGVSSTVALNRLEPVLTQLMASGTEITPMDYSSSDLAEADARGELSEFIEHHRSLYRAGLSRVRRRHNGDSVSFMVAGAGFQILGFGELLAAAVADNAKKLGEARPRLTHLAVMVARWDVSDSPSETLPPALPEEIDALWIVHPTRGNRESLVWLAHRGDHDWRLITSVVVQR